MRFLEAHVGSRGGDALVTFTPNVLNEETLCSVADDLVCLAKESCAKALHLDVGRVDFLTASALSGLVALRGRLLNEGISFALCNVKGRVYEVITLMRLTDVLGVQREAAASRRDGVRAVEEMDDRPAGVQAPR